MRVRVSVFGFYNKQQGELTLKNDMRRYENVTIDALVPYENNARTHSSEQLEKIKASIQEFGFINPILIDGKFNVIAGHGRIEAAKLEGYTELPCLFVEDLSDAQKRAYIIADNRLALDAGWDFAKLKFEFEELGEMKFDLETTGFNMDEIMEILSPEEDIHVTEDDFEYELPVEPKSQRGQVYQLGDHRLMCGDSTVSEDVAKLMRDDLAHMVFTDPPWNVNYGDVKEGNSQGYKPRTILNDFMGTESFKDFMFNAFKNMNDASLPGCMTYIVMSAQEWGNMMLTLAMNEYHWSSTIIWSKDRLVLSRKDYHTRYEPIWYGWKDGSRICPLEDRKQSDVWDIPRPSKSDLHPTMKPIEMLERAIKNSSHQGNIILDLFGGSGTTLIAAEQSNRQCRMMELDPQYMDVIILRWETLTGRKAELISETLQ